MLEVFDNKRKKLNISFVVIPQSHFKVPKLIKLNAARPFNMKTPNKRKLQKQHQIVLQILGFKSL